MAAVSRFWVFWIRNTIRKVTMVVPVLMTSCQLSENLKIGPDTAQTTTMTTQRQKVTGRPAAVATTLAALEKDLLRFMAAQRSSLGPVPVWAGADMDAK